MGEDRLRGDPLLVSRGLSELREGVGVMFIYKYTMLTLIILCNESNYFIQSPF